VFVLNDLVAEQLTAVVDTVKKEALEVILLSDLVDKFVPFEVPDLSFLGLDLVLQEGDLCVFVLRDLVVVALNALDDFWDLAARPDELEDVVGDGGSVLWLEEGAELWVGVGRVALGGELRGGRVELVEGVAQVAGGGLAVDDRSFGRSGSGCATCRRAWGPGAQRGPAPRAPGLAPAPPASGSPAPPTPAAPARPLGLGSASRFCLLPL